MISVKSLSFKYENSADFALRDISLEVQDGGFLGIAGHSGAGKSTLLMSLNGIVPHRLRGEFYGAVTIDGADTVKSSPEALSAHVGSVLQDIESQILTTVVEDEVMFGLDNFGFTGGEAETRLEHALSATGISDLRGRKISTLSGGQKQKTVISSVLALSPDILVLDEPTGELDPQSSRNIYSLLRKLNAENGMTIVIAEQKTALLCEFARGLAVMNGGKVAMHGSVRNVLRNCRALDEAGVQAPDMARLAERLTEHGFYSGAAPTNLDEAERMAREAAA